MERKFIYPKLPAVLHLFIRFMGSGLANCLFVYARAIILSEKFKIPIIEPTWVQFNLGPYLRREKDKRHYWGLFKSFGVSDLTKFWILLTRKKISENVNIANFEKGVVWVEGLGNYFEDIRFKSNFVKEHLLSITNEKDVQTYKNQNEKFIGVHVRLGDYSEEVRTNLDWFVEKINFINANVNHGVKFYIFSDGSEQELSELLKISNCQFVRFGSALADILVLSKAKLILASNSTFSAWSAYLGQVPIVFDKKHFGKILDNENNEIVEFGNDSFIVRQNLKIILDKYFAE